jgi:hypothetical protein
MWNHQLPEPSSGLVADVAPCSASFLLSGESVAFFVNDHEKPSTPAWTADAPPGCPTAGQETVTHGFVEGRPRLWLGDELSGAVGCDGGPLVGVAVGGTGVLVGVGVGVLDGGTGVFVGVLDGGTGVFVRVGVGVLVGGTGVFVLVGVGVLVGGRGVWVGVGVFEM